MKLLDLHISGFGKFHDRDITFEDGLNVVYGHNETGKSTLHTFIRCMLFGLERGRGRAAKNDLYSKYEPWENKAVYGGRLRLEQDGTVYRIERNFQKDQKSLSIVNETLGKEMEPTGAFMDQLLCGLNEISYTNTISIGQLKSATDSGMVTELRNFIANMNTSGNMALNITKATAHLKARRKEFERQLEPDAARSYASLVSEIRGIEKDISAPEYENQLLTYQNMRSQVNRLLNEKQQERESLLQKIAKGRQALEGAQFTDETSITSYQAEALNTYSKYQLTRAASEKKSRTVLAVICLILSVIFVGTSGYLAALGTDNPLAQTLGIQPLLLLLGSVAALCITAVLGCILLLNSKRLKTETAMNSKILQEIFSRHLGDSTISDEALTAFKARMEEFLRLSQILVQSEQSVQEKASEITALQEQASTCDDAISRQQRTQWELEKKLDHLARCKDQVEALKQTLAENERIREEITAIDLALDTMTELSATIRDSFGLYLNKTASDLISGITGGIYNSMSVDENLNIFMNTRTKLVPVDQVSSGTMDQIYLALRLAAAKLIQSGHDEMPLIFDDSFVLYDDDRLKTALKWLACAFDGQIIIFTCHQREAQMLTANQVKYHLITM
ncbi:MAG: AAA family ATPase [Lachnospiraceae bacterium]|nr:AAA family ATPase [Lachnospiraceae bacterium]